VRPLQAISVLGFVLAALGFAYAAIVIANAVFGRPIDGWSSSWWCSLSLQIRAQLWL
jgi:hypothetical protein